GRARRLPRRAELVSQHRPQLGAAGAMDGRQGHRPRAVRDRGSRSRPRLPRHGPAPARAQALRSGSTRHDRSPGLWPLDAAGAAGRGQRGHAAIPGGGEVMAVTGFEVTLRRPLAGGAPFGDVGPYEELKGRLRYAIDPSHAANRGVTDVALAPRNAAGLVEFSADLSLLVPVLRARPDVSEFAPSARSHQAHAAADLDERDAVLTVRDMPDAEPEVIPRGKWKFARAENGRATPDPRHVWLEGGFTKGRLYHVAYTATGAQVVGLGPVALRDCAAWL